MEEKMAKSIAQQVAEYLESHPAATNTDLYHMFPQVRENTLRNYKYKFRHSVDQFRNSRKRGRSSKKSAPHRDSKTPSLRASVFEFFSNNPNASNQELYNAFAAYSKNKLRHYKASFFKDLQPSAAARTKTPNALKSKPAASKGKQKSLEERIANLEEQVGYLTDLLLRPQDKSSIKSALITKPAIIEKKVKDLEDSIATFIAAQRKKIKLEMSHLEDIQKFVSQKVSTFMKEFK